MDQTNHYVVVKGLSKHFGASKVFEDLSFAIEEGEFITLLGPSGCGKSTLLRCLAGLETPDAGSIFVNGEDITHTKPQKRGIGMVFQSYALFPNMTAAENIAFGLKMQGLEKNEILHRVAQAIRTVELTNNEKKYPNQLSGGQRQRVALARALVVKPRILLLDEPLSALDARIRRNLRDEIRSIQREMQLTTIFVTHDQEEALTMSDTIVVMNKGKIQQIGRPEDIYNEPKNAFVADFIGESNILDGVMLEDYVVKFFGRKFQCVDKGFAPNEPVDVVIRPEDVDIVPPEQGHLCGTVTSVTFKGVHYDTIVDFKGFKWLIQTTDYCPVDAYIGIRLNPEDIHIMHKSEYSGLYGDYSSYSAEYDEIADASEEEDDEE